MRYRPNGRNGKWINLGVAASVVPFDVVKLRRALEGIVVPVQIAQPVVNRRVSRTHIAEIALEMLDVDRVETNHCDVSVSTC